MPIKLRRMFEREYGDDRGKRIFYAWQNKKKCSCNKKKEISLGMKVEREHNQNKAMTRKIALDHIKEYPCYYSKGLIPMERKLKRMNRR